MGFLSRLPAAILFGLAATFPAAADEAAARLETVLEDAADLEPLRTVIVARDGEVLAERGYHGNDVDAATNIKSASKSIVSALVGIAIDRNVLEGADQKIAPLLEDDLPAEPDPRLSEITIGNLLSMQAGLERTSGGNYGRWISSANWVRHVLSRDFADEPGGRMLYSTGSTHLLSAILTRASGRSTLELARDWLGPVEGFAISDWLRDPQGVYMGGNQMAMTPRSLLAFGELYRNGGRAGEEQVLPAEWIGQSWKRRTRSVFNGEGYGYGWFVSQEAGHDLRYAWGHGGQMLYILPELDLTVVMTSDPTQRSAGTGHRDDLRALLGDIVAAIGERDQARSD